MSLCNNCELKYGCCSYNAREPGSVKLKYGEGDRRGQGWLDREQVSLLRALLPIDGFTKGPFVGSHLFTQFKNHVNNKRSKQKMVCLNCRSCEERRDEDANCEDHVDTKHLRGKLYNG